MEIFAFYLFDIIVIPITMIVFGYLFMKRPPKEINSLFGYRTTMSSKNQNTWDFAHRYAGRVWLNSGIFTVIISVILIFILKDSNIFEKIVFEIFVIQFIILFLVIPLTEIALRKTFHKNGKFRNIT